jgi:hypothetical protein
MAMKPKKTENYGNLRTKPSLDEAAAAKRAGAAIAKRNTEKSRQYSPAPMTAAQKEKMRRAAEKKSALIKMKKDPIVKGAKAVLKAGANPVGAAAMVAGKAAGMYVKAGKAVAGAIKDKVSPPKRGVGGGKKLFPNQKPGGTSGKKNGFTPEQLAELKKLFARSGRLDK